MTPIIHCWALHFAQMLNTFQMSMSDDSMLFKMIQYSNVKIYDDRYHDLSQEGQWLAKKSHKWMWSLFPLVEYFETYFGVCIKATGKQVSSPSLVDVCLQFSRSGLAITL